MCSFIYLLLTAQRSSATTTVWEWTKRESPRAAPSFDKLSTAPGSNHDEADPMVPFRPALTVGTRPTPMLDRRAAVAIASPGPDEPELRETRFGRIRSRSGARLKHTVRDAERVYALFRESEPEVPDELHRLLIDPTVRDVERAVWDVSSTGNDIGLDLFFAGHGEEGTGGLVLKDGILSPTRLLELHGGQGTIGVWLDSCYSGAFLLRLAIDGWPWLVDGFASCLPDEMCFEMDALEHGVFTYTRLHPGNAHVNQERFNQAILDNDPEELRKGLQGLVGMTSSPSAFLTEGGQFSMTLYKHSIEVDGGFAMVELGETNDLADITRRLTRFKRVGISCSSSVRRGRG